MREILFKGKEKDSGRWVEGYYQKRYDYSENIQHLIFWAKSSTVWEYIEVDPETVCQYTGLTDKNGRKIFEGDICEFAAYGEDYKGDVRFIKGNFTIWCGKCAPFLDDSLEKHSAIVIGNIFDNPELIGEQP